MLEINIFCGYIKIIVLYIYVMYVSVCVCVKHFICSFIVLNDLVWVPQLVDDL